MVQERVDQLTSNCILIPPIGIEGLCEREQAIGSASALIGVDKLVREKIAEIERELAEHERPEAAERRSEHVEPGSIDEPDFSAE